MSPAALDATQAAALLAKRLDLAARLTLGQVVRVQVVQRGEGNRYLVRLLGEQVLVESRGELRPGESLDARVTGLDGRIELERTARQAHASLAEAGEPLLAGLSSSASGELIAELFRRYRASLRGAEAQTLERHVARAARPDSMALAGLVLRKAALPVEAELLEPLYEALSSANPMRAEPGAWPVAERILNTQAGGSVSHQVGRLAIGAGDGSVQAQFAFFEERDDGAPDGELRHRKAVLVLDLARLGRVEARAVSTGDRLRVVLASESPATTSALLRQAEELVRALAEAAWQVDEIRHETRPAGQASGAVAAAVEHLIVPGSVSLFL